MGSRLGRVSDVRSSFYSLGCVRIGVNCLWLCIRRCAHKANIPRVAWCRTFFFLQGVQLAMDSVTRVEGAAIAIV